MILDEAGPQSSPHFQTGAHHVSIETISYMGLPNCLKLSNGVVDIIATTAVGPRILYYGPANGENILAHFPDSSKETALGTWKAYGGHRLWVWPELFPGSYAPDNDQIEYTQEGDLSLLLRQPSMVPAFRSKSTSPLPQPAQRFASSRPLRATTSGRWISPRGQFPWCKAEPPSCPAFPFRRMTNMSPSRSRSPSVPSPIFRIQDSPSD